MSSNGKNDHSPTKNQIDLTLTMSPDCKSILMTTSTPQLVQSIILPIPIAKWLVTQFVEAIKNAEEGKSETTRSH